jgi:hypothetical protein
LKTRKTLITPFSTQKFPKVLFLILEKNQKGKEENCQNWRLRFRRRGKG